MPRLMRLPAHPLLACALSLPALAGCGSAEPTAHAQDRTLRIQLDEYRYEPQVARAPTGEVVLELRNVGRLPHNLVLERNGRELLKVPTMLPERDGKPNVVRVKVTLRGGDYRMLCSISNHEELGQYGTLQVRRPR